MFKSCKGSFNGPASPPWLRLNQGDCKAVARTTCETARQRNAINFADAMLLEPA